MFRLSIIHPKNQKKLIFGGSSIDSLVKQFHAWSVSTRFYPYDDIDKAKELVRESAIQVDKKPSKKSKPKVSLSTSKIIAAATTAFEIVSGNTADQNEVDRRTRICDSCQYNKRSQVGSCATCRGAAVLAAATNAASKFFGNQVKTPKRARGHYCSYCSCSLDILLNMKDIRKKKETDEENMGRPNNCWLRLDNIK